METIDFRTWKQKRDEASNKIKIGFQNGWHTVKNVVHDYPLESIGLLTVGLTGVFRLGNSAVRMHMANKERRFDMRHEYDRKTDMHWYAKKDLSTNQRLEIERRYNQGESKGSIMRSMGLI